MRSREGQGDKLNTKDRNRGAEASRSKYEV